ncbi:hypothetical protein B0H14DRAFT_3457380 [Mycena olivaceomarginata]|nr:hypothetical protein B0H14DRAFT_3457380 [Mycena olivaceomarginata]
MTTGKPYSGPRGLVFGIDVGTTYSGISYSILEPGQVPQIHQITRFPGQQDVGGDSKIPTAIYYDLGGIIRAEGAETTLAACVEQAEEDSWEHAQWFKLHLRPTVSGPELPPLPHRKTATSVLADFLRYLFECAKKFIKETHTEALWASLQHNIQFVMAHPNGWQGKQQSQMRDAAVVAGLIPHSDAGHQRLRFVTEGEASLHFCIRNGLGTQAIDSGKGVVIVDAGGGTIDLSSYRQIQRSDGYKEYEEIAPAQCLFQGSIYVTQRAREYVQGNTKYAADIDHIAQIFDTSAKLSFRGEEFAFVKFGTKRDQDPKLNIRNGQLKIPGSDVKKLFEPSISAVVDAVREQCISAVGGSATVSSVFLVGGFAANDWLFSELKSRLESLTRLDVTRPDARLNKAVADGAVSFYIDHHVSVRVARFTYGMKCSEPYNAMNNEHLTRLVSRYQGVSGEWLIPGRFSAILNRKMQVRETKEFRESYNRRSSNLALLDHFSTELYIYTGGGDPQWLDVAPVCRIEANTSGLTKYPTYRPKVPNSTYYELKFDVILSFGLTELKAQIAWVENGVEKR